MRRSSVARRNLYRLADPEADASPAELEEVARWRPRTRAQCQCSERPCPYAGCRFSLLLDAGPYGGIFFPWGQSADPADLPETCALDVADRGGATQEEVARYLNLSPQRVVQIEAEALGKLRALGRWSGAPED